MNDFHIFNKSKTYVKFHLYLLNLIEKELIHKS